jgi:hypothetical protein
MCPTIESSQGAFFEKKKSYLIEFFTEIFVGVHFDCPASQTEEVSSQSK